MAAEGENGKSVVNSGKLSGCMTAFMKFLGIGMIVFFIVLPYVLQNENRKTEEAARKNGYKEVVTTVTRKHIDVSTDSDGDSTDTYYIYFPEGRIESESWYEKVKEGDTITVYTVNDKKFAFTKEELYNSEDSLCTTFTISNSIVAILLGMLLFYFYKKSREKNTDDSYLINRLPEFTVGEFITVFLVPAQFITYKVAPGDSPFVVLFINGLWLIVHIRNRRKKTLAEN